MKDVERIEQEAATWVARRDGEDFTSEDAAQLRAWMRADPLHAETYIRILGAWTWVSRVVQRAKEDLGLDAVRRVFNDRPEPGGSA
jgi:ferric-dicitrate binding protein FerR (iron transport regulator)